MKKLLPILFISISLFGCSSLELEAISSSEEETQRILALGLSHEENLLEASKLSSSHMVSVVTLQLDNAREEKIQNEIDFVESDKFAEMVSISEDNLNFMGPEIVNSVKKGVLQTDIDVQTHFLSGKKSEDGELVHKLNITIEHNSSKKRQYLSANLCDKWMRCDGNEQALIVISSNASGCLKTGCNYVEKMELSFEDELLKNMIDSGFTLRINTKRSSNKIKVPSAYLRGYLKIAN